MRSHFRDIVPKEMDWTDDGKARFLWSDGHESVYPAAALRRMCPCADCKGTHGTPPKAFNIVTTRALAGAPRQLNIESVEPVGNYAIAFTWGDGHREGIYTWDLLRDECPCGACKVRRNVEQEGHK